MIRVENLRKDFRVFRHREGVWGAFRDLFQREYRTLAAVDGINLSMCEGEFVGYIGPNGAGKSTTIKMLTGILVPNVRRDRRQRFPALPGQDPLHEDHRRRVRPAHPALVGHRGHRELQAAAPHLRCEPARFPGAARRFRRAAGAGRLSPCPGAQAQPRAADALRHRRRAAPQPAHPLPGRAHDRAGRRRQGPDPGVSSRRSTAISRRRSC